MRHIGKPRLLIIGCGDVGQRLLPYLTRYFRVFALTPSPEKVAHLRLHGVIPIQGDLDQINSLWRLPHLAARIVHLAPPQSTGLEDRRTRNLLAILSQGSSFIRQLVYISTTGVYGDHGGAWVNECTVPTPGTARAKRRVSAETRLRAWGIAHQVGISILRVPGIYAHDRLPLERIRHRTPALQDSEDVFTNHIHADDLARIIFHALFKAKNQRLINVCDESDMKMGEYFDAVANTHGLPPVPRVTRVELLEQVEPMLASFMSESRRMRGDRIKELRVGLQYPTVNDYLAFTSKYLSNQRSD